MLIMDIHLMDIPVIVLMDLVILMVVGIIPPLIIALLLVLFLHQAGEDIPIRLL
jgi:hypothetical protein